MNCANGIFRFEEAGHQRRELLRNGFGVRGRLQRKRESKVILAHLFISLTITMGTQGSAKPTARTASARQLSPWLLQVSSLRPPDPAPTIAKAQDCKSAYRSCL